MTVRTCKIPECGRKHDAKGYCSTHYTRWKRYGDPLVLKRLVMVGSPPADRFWARVDKLGEGDCWEWTGATHPAGYGNFNAGGGVYTSSHRFSYELHSGAPIPDGMEVCHSCDNPPCVNPAHLWLGTHLDNMRDMDAKGRCDRWGNR